MARHRRGQTTERVGYNGPSVQAFQIFRERTNRGDAVLAIEDRGQRANAKTVAAELLHLEAQSIEIGSMRDDRLKARWRQLDQQRFEQPLAFEPA